MEKNYKIELDVLTDENIKVKKTGVIVICEPRNEYQIYCSWRVDDYAAVSKNYFSGESGEDDIVEKVIADIEKYRILRKRVFSNVKVVD